MPKDKVPGAAVFAGTVVESGALDIETERIGGDTTFSRIVAMVENAEAQQAPVQKLADNRNGHAFDGSRADLHRQGQLHVQPEAAQIKRPVVVMMMGVVLPMERCVRR